MDLTHGQPAANVKIELSYLTKSSVRNPLKTATTNADGRIDHPLLTADEMKAGEYELLFHIGDYFRKKELNLKEPLFLDKVAVRIGIADPHSHYHVPLLISPWGYQVYRGS
ncbi:hydroxyisourate hydrolase [Bacillus songklensis]|uniref:5-hydroxyisourate hydrolase n=1 Tax=Bacillus songklensis TaxID=1069116 RepID=A0ABV8B4A5_9BACI